MTLAAGRPTLAVLITYYNEGPLLAECLESLRRQEEEPDEVWILDGGSSIPAKPFVSDRYTSQLLRNESNLGPSFARNFLAKHSQAEYVHFQDADDLFLPGFVSRIRSSIADRGPDLVLNQVSVDHPGAARIHARSALADVSSDLLGYLLGQGASTQMLTFRRRALLDAGGFDEELWHREDAEIAIRMAAGGAVARVIEEPLVAIRMRGGSHSGASVQAARHALIAAKKISAYIPSQYRQFVAEALAEVGLRFYAMNMPGEGDAAMRLAQSHGRPSFRHMSRIFRVASQLLGARRAVALRTWMGGHKK